MSIKQILQRLEALQAVDLQIAELKRSGESYPKEIARLDADLAEYRARLDAERERLAANEQGRRAKETEITDEKDKLKKWEVRLADQRTTREYAALAREIDIAAKHVQGLEHELKLLNEQTGGIVSAVKVREGEMAAREASTSTERADFEEKLAHFTGALQAMEEKRANAAEGLDRGMLSRYDMVRIKRGSGLALVLGGVCKGCNLRLPPQLQNILRATPTLQNCPSCSRYIYTPEMTAE